jgi:hypothetical protein
MCQWFFKLFGWPVEENIIYKDLAMKTLEFFSGLLHMWSHVGFLHVNSPLIGQGKSMLKYTCQGRFTEQFAESQPGSRASFTVTGRFLNAATQAL